jgi:hypothetical protein
MTHWIRGYLCNNGFKYYCLNPVEDENEARQKKTKAQIKGDLSQGEEARLQMQTKKYIEAPINKEGPEALSKTKYYHCQMFGLNTVDENFYQEWIDKQDYHKMNNLIVYLSSSPDHIRKQTKHIMNDYMVTEKTITACKLFQALLTTVGFDLKSFFFTGMPKTQVAITLIPPDQSLFINNNKKDLLLYFGPVARIRYQMTTTYHLIKYVSRLLNSYLGLEFICSKKRARRGTERPYEEAYELKISDQIYELLSYRVLAYRNKTLRWLLPKHVCGQLKDKYRTIKKQWTHLTNNRDWPECPEIDQKTIPKIKIKLKTISKIKIKLKTIPKIKIKLKTRPLPKIENHSISPPQLSDDESDMPPPKFSPDQFDEEESSSPEPSDDSDMPRPKFSPDQFDEEESFSPEPSDDNDMPRPKFSPDQFDEEGDPPVFDEDLPLPKGLLMSNRPPDPSNEYEKYSFLEITESNISLWILDPNGRRGQFTLNKESIVIKNGKIQYSWTQIGDSFNCVKCDKIFYRKPNETWKEKCYCCYFNSDKDYQEPPGTYLQKETDRYGHYTCSQCHKGRRYDRFSTSILDSPICGKCSDQ